MKMYQPGHHRSLLLLFLRGESTAPFLPFEKRVLHFIQDIPVPENQWYGARATSAVNKLEVLQVISEKELEEGGVEFSSDENMGDEQEIFMTPTGTPEGYGQIRN